MNVHVLAAENGYEVELCVPCNGVGSRVVREPAVMGWIYKPCDLCEGSGRAWTRPSEPSAPPLSDRQLVDRFGGK